MNLLEQLLAAVRAGMTSQVVGGGLVLMLTGALLALARNVPGRIVRLIERQFTVTVDVVSGDSLFGWLALWLDEQPYSKRARRVSASSVSTGNQVAAPVGAGSQEQDKPRVLFTPAPGNHLLWVDGRPIWLSRERKETERDGWSQFRETFTLRMLGRDPTSARALLERARDMAYVEAKRTTGVHVIRYGDWYRIHETPPRRLESVVLPEGVMEGLVADAEEFLAAEVWYRDRGIPWRRGYLFEGTPGSGKTSTIAALAGHLGLDLYLCNVGDRGMNDERLLASLLSVRQRSAVLLEDIDAVVEGRAITAESSGVTFAGLLNALDGVASQSGVLTFMTTNHPDKLDPALIRHGRVDKRVHFAPTTPAQAARFFCAFYQIEDAGHFGRHAAGRTTAELQGFLLQHRHDPAGALRAIVLHIEQHESKTGGAA